MLSDLSLSMKIDRMIKNANQSVLMPPKVFKSETTAEMIDDYKRSLTKPIEIDGKLYKYHPATIAVTLETPNTQLSEFEREAINPDLYKGEIKASIELIDRFDQMINEHLSKYQKTETKYRATVTDLENKKRELLRERDEKVKIKTIQTKKGPKVVKSRTIKNYDLLIDELDNQINEKVDEIRQIYDEAKKEYDELLKKKMEAEEKHSTAGAEYNRLTQMKDADEVEIRRVAEINKKKIDEYINNIKSLNPRPVNFSKGMNETDEQFLERIDNEIKEEIDQNLDDEQAKTEALSINRKKLLSLLSDITTDINKKESIISGIITDEFDPDPVTENIYQVVKFWEPIKRYIKRRYPKGEANIDPKEYVTDIIDMIRYYLKNKETVEQMGESDEKQPSDEKKTETEKAGGLFLDYTVGDYYITLRDPTTNNIRYYFKAFHAPNYPGYKKEKRMLYLTGSRTGEKGSFKIISDEKALLSIIGKTGLKDLKALFKERKELFDELTNKHGYNPGAKLSTVLKMAMYLSHIFPKQDPGAETEGVDIKDESRYNDIRYEKNRDGRRGKVRGAGIIRGGAIATDKPNVYQKYGDVLINVRKLNKNILAVKDDKERSIYGFPNKNISDFLADMINMLIDNIRINDNLYKGLDESEKIIFDQLITHAGTRKKTKKDISDSIKYLKNKYNVLSGSIEAGNDNPELIKEVRITLQQLYKMGQIKPKDIKELISNLESINK